MHEAVQSPWSTDAVERRTAASPPLCVDLDGTLVKSDTLLDSILVLARRRPADLLKLPGWLTRGKAGFKLQVAERAQVDVSTLPLNRPLVEFLQSERASGREIYLATGANDCTAQRVAAHLGIFDAVICSDATTNLTGQKKLDTLAERFAGSFDYVGNSATDLPVLKAAQAAMLANPTRRLRAKLQSAGVKPARTFVDRRRRLLSFISAIRVHQWAKNTLIFLPLLLAHKIHDGDSWVSAVLAFEAFSFAASSAYIFNDLLDLEADRAHPRKSRRPFAAADLSPLSGVVLGAVLLCLAILLAVRLPGSFAIWLAGYYITTMLYSLALKRVVRSDV